MTRWTGTHSLRPLSNSKRMALARPLRTRCSKSSRCSTARRRQATCIPTRQAFKEGATDEDYCYIERVDDDLVLLRRKLPSGRVISIDTCDFAMLNGGAGIAHLNMNNSDNRVKNLKWVKEGEARKMLMDFEEISEMRDAPTFFAMYSKKE